jgi:hypothetical protein
MLDIALHPAFLDPDQAGQIATTIAQNPASKNRAVCVLQHPAALRRDCCAGMQQLRQVAPHWVEQGFEIIGRNNCVSGIERRLLA